MGYGVSVSRTADVGVARQALAVRREVAALGLLKPDHIRSVTLYGGNVEIRPVAPGVLLARVVERPPDVETHHPEHGTAQTPIHLLSIACPRFYPHDLSRRLHLQQLRLHTNFRRDTLRLQREKNRRAIPDYSQRSTRIRTKRVTGTTFQGGISVAHTLRHSEDPHVHADPQVPVLLRPPAPRRPVLHGHQPPVPPQALR